jgi:UDP-N-acetylglucosamine--N-acetylmuramyl-(pentapeptide) pyrophosphoryl-undecaprenol N-acetylglucosamine transferase
VKVVVTGGGTGGHIYPALAVVEAIRRLDPANEVRYIGGVTGMEAQIVPAAGVPFTGVTTKKLTKVLSPGTIGVLFALFKGYREARAVMKAWKPDLAIGTGGYVAGAAIIAAAKMGCPTMILSPDAVPGRTNLLLSRWSKRIGLWLGDTASAFPSGKTLVTGLPIRSDVLSKATVQQARAELGLRENTFTVFVIGGSQGAQRVNELVVDAVGLLDTGIQILHQTGPKNHNDVLARVKEKGSGGAFHLPLPYLDSRQIPLAYRAADVVLCRSGVSTLAEGTANGRPLLMVPLPTSYADHQSFNARAIEAGGGGMFFPQLGLTPEILAAVITDLRNDNAKRDALAKASLSLGRPGAADEVVRLAVELM